MASSALTSTAKRKRTSGASTTATDIERKRGRRNSDASYTVGRPRRSVTRRRDLDRGEESQETSEESKTSEESQASETLYSARAILKERIGQYLIAWEGTDPRTGKPWELTWEPKSYANEALVAEWEDLKAAKKKAAFKVTPKPERRRRVVESSPDLDRGSSLVRPNGLSHSHRSSPVATQAGQTIGNVLYVEVTRPGDFDPDQYQRFPQVPLTQDSQAEAPLTQYSQPPPSQERTFPKRIFSQRTSPERTSPERISPYRTFSAPGSSPAISRTSDSISSSQIITGTPRFPASSVIPDTQSLPDSQGYVPSTQAASGPKRSQFLQAIESYEAREYPIVSTSESAPLTQPSEADWNFGLEEQAVDIPQLRSQPLEKEVQGFQPEEICSPPDLLPSPRVQTHMQEESTEESGFTKPSQTKTVASLPTPERTLDHSVSFARSLTQQEQHAQVIPSDSYFSTQEDSHQSVRLTTEHHISNQPTGPLSVISVAEPSLSGLTLERPVSPVQSYPSQYSHSFPSPDHSSPLLKIPSHSLAIDTQASERPHTPVYSSVGSVSISMSDSKGSELFQQLFNRDNPKAFAESSSGPGTRSPSTIPDRTPQQQVPTSLQTTTLANPTTPDPAATVAPVLLNSPRVHTASEVEQDYSLLTDDIHLLSYEFIVPLPVEGRQRDRYRQEFKKREEDVKTFVEAPPPASLENVPEVNELVETLKAVEVHADLLDFDSTSQNLDIGPATQAEWDKSNYVKFRFLAALFDSLIELGREEDMHIILVLENKRQLLLNMVEKFLQGIQIDYDYPAAGRKADPEFVRGGLKVTILGNDVGVDSVSIAHAIICLDGSLNALQIRSKGWGVRAYDHLPPILYLIIPKSIEHIERCLSHLPDPTKRLHALVTCAAQLRAEFGRPSLSTPRAEEAAAEVASFLLNLNTNEEEWPLPPIGGVKDLVTYLEHETQPLPASSVHGPTQEGHGPSKRPLDFEELDPSKRMRMTPQPQPRSTQSNLNRSSDRFRPGAQTQMVQDLQVQLEEKQNLLACTKQQLKQRERELRQLEHALDRRQTDYEDMSAANRALQKQLDAANSKLEALQKAKEAVEERFRNKCAEVDSVKVELLELQGAAVASDDGKLAKIAELHKALSESRAAEERAVKKADTAEQQNTYFISEYQNATRRASELQATANALEKQKEAFRKRAEGEAAELKRVFIEKNHKAVMNQNETLKTEVGVRDRLILQKDEEIRSVRTSRGVGMGTRASSVPRSPRVGGNNTGSRANSPLPGGRVGLLRNG
ncbi:hypothetical protein GQ43DRAFT_479737 [Delitschia confertaspora ATCC 74209]|uniref:Chromo domain-containing protein n=1 Tax=Delitschia confertaspora ATCC 74209 TaxID=1513339 RepID=A0A9P4MWX5_9PLEO|nr:hypothetical protein GQ43DRAFT_479737 [Delitschia confertaspora ATCC 74209]